MNIPLGRTYRLVGRSGPGLACDKEGASLGPVELVRARVDAVGTRHCEVRPAQEIGRILRTAYGAQPEEVVQRLYRGLQRAAVWIESGDIGRAGVEAVMLRLPDLSPTAMAKLGRFADLEKANTAWQTEPRVPAGQNGGGQWTSDGGVVRPRGSDPSSDQGGYSGRPILPLDDGVYRPGRDDPFLIHTGGIEEDEPRMGSNGPPADVDSLEELFPGLKDNPGLAIPLAPIDGFLGISASANAANIDGTRLLYRFLVAQIKTLDPNFADQELLPPEGIAGLSWRGRIALINGLRMQRAATLYRFNGDVRLLQVETLRFLQDAVDDAYGDAVSNYNAGRLKPRISREEAIGNYLDNVVRRKMRELFNTYDILYGPRSIIKINNREYDTSGAIIHYTIPDARIGSVLFDWTLTMKTLSNPQIRGFFAADSRPLAVIIIRPTQLGQNSTYLINRPLSRSPRR